MPASLHTWSFWPNTRRCESHPTVYPRFLHSSKCCLVSFCSSGLYVSLIRKNQDDINQTSLSSQQGQALPPVQCRVTRRKGTSGSNPLCAFPSASLVSSHMCDWPSPWLQKVAKLQLHGLPQTQGCLSLQGGRGDSAWTPPDAQACKPPRRHWSLDHL